MLDPEVLGHAGIMSNSLNNEVAICLFSAVLSFTVVRIVHRSLLRFANRVGCQHKPEKDIETASRRTFSPLVLSKSTVYLYQVTPRFLWMRLVHFAELIKVTLSICTI